MLCAPPVCLGAQTVDQYATNAAAVSVPTGATFPAGTFPPANVCLGTVLKADLTLNVTPFTKVRNRTIEE